MRWFIWLFAASALLSSAALDAAPPKRLLLVGQAPDGHPRGTHEYRAAMPILARVLAGRDDLTTEIVSADGVWEAGPDRLANADGVVLFVSEGARWLGEDARRLAAFQKLAARGGGLAVVHWGMGCKDAEFIPAFVRLFGGCHGGPDRKYQVVKTTLAPAEPRHAIAAGIGPIELQEEFYYRLKWAPPPAVVQPVLQARIDGESQTVAWAYVRPEGGRSFGFSGLHFHEHWSRPEYRRLVGQGVLWTLGLAIPDKGLAVDVPAELLRLPEPK